MYFRKPFPGSGLRPNLRGWARLGVVEWPNTVLGDEAPGIGRNRRKAGRRDGLTFGLLVGQFEIQPEQEAKGVSARFHPIGDADGGVEGGLGVAQAVGAGGFEGAIEVAQRPAVGWPFVLND